MKQMLLKGCNLDQNVILSLPSSLQNELFCEWLGIADLGRLDSAICNRIHRDTLLSTWKDAHCIHKPSEEIVVTELFAAWVISRRIKIGKDVSIPEFVAETESCKAFFESIGNTLTMIRYPEGFQFQELDSPESINSMRSVVERASTCSNLQEFILARIDMGKVSLRPVLENCTNLKRLSLGFSRCLNFRELNECGQYIEQLDLLSPSGKVAPENPDQSDFAVLKKTNTMKKLNCMFVSLDYAEMWG